MRPAEEAKLELIIRRMQADTAVDAPRDAIIYAKNLYRSRAAETMPSILSRIVAVLTSDLAAGVPAFGERSAATGKARQMLFEAGETAIDLRVDHSGETVSIRGQILGDGFENGSATLIVDETELPVAIDEFAEFSFTDVPAGRAELIIRPADGSAEIAVGPVDLP